VTAHRPGQEPTECAARVPRSRESETWAAAASAALQKADCARFADERLVNREGAATALARVVSFEGVSKDRMEEMRGEMRDS
jgi:hypothetical protein